MTGILWQSNIVFLKSTYNKAPLFAVYKCVTVHSQIRLLHDKSLGARVKMWYVGRVWLSISYWESLQWYINSYQWIDEYRPIQVYKLSFDRGSYQQRALAGHRHRPIKKKERKAMAGFILTSHGNRSKKPRNQTARSILKFPSLHLGSFEHDVRNLMLRIFVIIFFPGGS